MHEIMLSEMSSISGPKSRKVGLVRDELAGMSEWDRISIIHIFKLH